MEAKGEISMRMVHCEDCGKRYDYDVDGFCPRCGAFNQLQGTETRRSSRRNRNFSRGRSPQHAGEREPIQLPRRGTASGTGSGVRSGSGPGGRCHF